MPTVTNTKAKPTKSATKPKASSKPKTPMPEGEDPLSRIVGLDTLEFNQLKMVIYGLSGSGKTRTVGSFADRLGPSLYMVCSSNSINEARSIKRSKNIQVVDIRRPSDFPALLAHARDNKFKTVVLDHGTEFADMILAEIIGLERLPEQKSWGLASRDQYGQLGLQAKSYFREFFDFPGNSILVGQERVFDSKEDHDPDHGIAPTVTYASTKSVSQWISPAADFMLRAYRRPKVITRTKKLTVKGKTTEQTYTETTNEVEYCLQLRPDAVHMAKFRSVPGVQLPAHVVVEDGQDVYEMLQEYMDEA